MRWIAFALALSFVASTRDAASLRAATSARSAQAPGSHPVAIKDATVTVAPLFTLAKGTVVLRDGLIEAVGPDVAVPAGAEVIDGKGLHVYAGFIDARSTLGLPDTKRTAEALRLAEGEKPEFAREAPPAMEQANRKGLRPDLDAANLVHVTEADAKKAHAGGFALAAVAAQDEFLSGRAALVTLSAAPRRSAIVRGATGLHAAFRSYGDGYPGTNMGTLAHLRQILLDARHYPKLWAAHKPGRPRPAVDPALEALQPVLRGEVPLVFEADTDREILRAIALSEEFGFKLVVSGAAEAYRVADLLKQKKVPVILSLKLPKEPTAKKDDDEPEKLKKERERLREEETRCAVRLFEAKVPFSFSTQGLGSPGEALANIQRLVERGLPDEAALAALTTAPAKLYGIADTHGAVAKGKAANLTVLTAPLGDKRAKVKYLFADGKKFEFDVKKAPGKPEIDVTGKYDVAVTLEGGKIEADLTLKQTGTDVSGTIKAHFGEAPVKGTVSGKGFEFTSTVTLGDKQVELTFKGERKDNELHGTVTGPQGEKEFVATLEAPPALPAPARKETPLSDKDVEIDADRKPRTRTGGNAFIRNATILTVADAGTIQGGSILVRDGKIAAVGKSLREPPGVTVIDATGLYVMPGIIDCHSHLAIDGGVNEGTQSVVPEVRIRDVIDHRDVGLYRALAGGVTSANILHGSANAIGGQNATVKLKYGKLPHEMVFHDAPRGVKFALGENPKQSNWGQNRGKRFPNTRMGVEATFRRAFTEAREYEARLKADPLTRRDLRLDALLGILRGEILVHCHCYRADEILMILQVAQDFGFRISTLQHVLEGYKVAPEIAAAGTGASTFSDWWAYKIEAFDAIPHNAALMTHGGVVVSINSDSDEQIRHLNAEAAKCAKYGGLSEKEALALVTLNPARQLAVDKYVGTVEVGKDADLALYNGHPLSGYSRCVTTIIEGEVYFEDREVPVGKKGFRVEDQLRRSPGPLPRGETVAIVNASIHPIVSLPFRGTLVIRKGKISELGPEVRAPQEAEVVDGTGLSVYPGLIDAYTNLGLTEIGSVAGTRDEAEIGGIQPDLKALTAVNPHSDLIPVTRANGITAALTLPEGGLIAGQSAVIRLDGWVPKEMALKEVFALHVNFPALKGTDDAKAEDEKKVKELKAPFEAAKRYDGRDKDLKLEALLPYVRKERPVVFHANRARDIKAAVTAAEDLGLRPIIAGGQEAWKVSKFLADKKVPVILSGVMTLPYERHDPYTATFSNPARLSKAGVKFAISSAQVFSGNSRNTPYHASWAAAYGLDREEALKSVTLYPAEILGVSDRLGTLEPGKAADLIVTTGDPLEIVTDVVYLFINGRAVSLESRHTRLHQKFQERLPKK